MAIEVYDFRRVSVGAETGSTSVLHSDGEIFWHSLGITGEQRTTLAVGIREVEASLGQQFDSLGIPTSTLTVRTLTLGTALEVQTDNQSCTLIALANTFRILDQPREEYSMRGLQARIGETPPSLARILQSGEPFDRFQVSAPHNMYTFLKKLQDGAVAILDWPHSPYRIRRNGEPYNHTRTVTGFTRNSDGLYFHLINPYYQGERAYSFRDLVVACLYQAIDLKNGITADSIDRVARSAWIIERISSPIRTVAAAM